MKWIKNQELHMLIQLINFMVILYPQWHAMLHLLNLRKFYGILIQQIVVYKLCNCTLYISCFFLKILIYCKSHLICLILMISEWILFHTYGIFFLCIDVMWLIDLKQPHHRQLSNTYQELCILLMLYFIFMYFHDRDISKASWNFKLMAGHLLIWHFV